MQVTRETGSDVCVFADSADSGGLMEVAGTDTSSNDVPVVAAGNVLHLFEFHDVHNLLADFSGSTHCLGM